MSKPLDHDTVSTGLLRTGTVIRLYDQHGDNLRTVGNPMNLLRQGCLPSEYWIGWGTALHSDGGRGDDHGNGRRNKKQF